MDFTDAQIDEIWKTAKELEGVNPDSYRKDAYGAWIRRCRYNDQSCPLSFGWVIVKQGRGVNQVLKPLQWQNAISGTSGKQRVIVSAEGFYNKYKKVNSVDISDRFQSNSE